MLWYQPAEPHWQHTLLTCNVYFDITINSCQRPALEYRWMPTIRVDIHAVFFLQRGQTNIQSRKINWSHYPIMNVKLVTHMLTLLSIYFSYPSRVDHAFRNASCTRRVHEEKRMVKRKLFEMQLRGSTIFSPAELNEVFQHHSTRINPSSWTI